MPTVQQLIRQAKEAHTPLAQTPLPPGVNPSAFAYQQSWLNAGGRYGVPGMIATGNPADNPTARNFTVALSNAANPAPVVPLVPLRDTVNPASGPFGDVAVPSSQPPSGRVFNYNTGQWEYAPRAVGSGSFVSAGPGGSQPRGYSDVPASANVISEKDYRGVTPDPTGLAAVGAMNAFLASPEETGGGYPGGIGPYGSYTYLTTGQLPTQSGALAGTPQATGAAVTPQPQPSPPPAPAPSTAPYVPPKYSPETDPLGSLYDAFQRSLNQATLPAGFSTTWGG